MNKKTTVVLSGSYLSCEQHTLVELMILYYLKLLLPCAEYFEQTYFTHLQEV
jgi:hypothetical protein